MKYVTGKSPLPYALIELLQIIQELYDDQPAHH